MFTPTFAFCVFQTSSNFCIFLHFPIFLSCSLKLLMFSSQTILVPQGNKEADKWIIAKLYFQFLCWFFSDRTIIPGWCAGVRALYGRRFQNNRQLQLNLWCSLWFLCFQCQILFWFYSMKEEWTIGNTNQQRNYVRRKFFGSFQNMIEDKFTKETCQNYEKERLIRSRSWKRWM